MAHLKLHRATVAPAGRLAQQLMRQGWHRGVPPQLHDWARAVDEAVCRRVYCGNCQRRGLLYRPFWWRGGYRVIGECPDCGFEEEF